MLPAALPVYLQDVSSRLERKGDEPTRLLVLHMTIQPFTTTMAKELGPGVRSKLFRLDDGEPVDDVQEITFSVPTTIQELTLGIGPDVENVRIQNARLSPRIRVRRDKETPAWAAGIQIDFPYPSKEDVWFLLNATNCQLYLTLAEMQGALNMDGAEPDESEEVDNAPAEEGTD